MSRFAAVGVVLLLGCLLSPPIHAEQRPNLIFILCDDLRHDALGCMGNSIVQTPHVDALAARGVTFKNAFVTTAICWTSRTNILFGQYGSKLDSHDARKLRTTKINAAYLKDTYLGQLKAVGYYLGYIGKWHVGDPPTDLFDMNAAYAGQGSYWLKVQGKPKHLTEHIGDQAVEFLKIAPKEQPFCLAVGFKAPHVQDGFKTEPYQHHPDFATHYETVHIPAPPLTNQAFFLSQPEFIRESMGRQRWEYRLGPPESLNFQRSVKRYYRMVSGVDAQVGRIIQALDQTGQTENTILVFTSEHGVYLGARGLAGKWLGHEPSIRIPLIVYDPRLPQSSQGSRRKEMVTTLDFAPTLMELGGANIPKAVQGRSLVPLLQGKPAKDWRTEYYYEYLAPIGTIPRSIGLRTERYKYLRYIDQQPVYEELYDLKTDPLEANNVATADAYQALLKQMQQKCDAWEKKAKQ